MNRRLALAAFPIAAFFALAACSDDTPFASSAGPSNDSDGPSNGVTVEVDALDNSFRPDRIEIEAGTEVVWTNNGQNDHDVLAIDGEGWGIAIEDFGPGTEYRHVFTEPGEYRYICTIHADADVPHIGMVGTVVVTPAA